MLPDPQLGRVFRVVRANITNVRETEQNYLSFFLQDTWQLGRRLTIKPGLRYEQQKLIGSPNQLEAIMSNLQKRAANYEDPA